MTTTNDRLSALWGTVQQPENLTGLLESFTLWSLAVAPLVFIVTWIFKETKAQKTALVLVVLGAAAPFAAPAPDASPLPGPAPWAFVALASLAGLTVFLGKGGKAGLWLTLLTLAGSLVVAALCLSLTLDPPVEPAEPAPAPQPFMDEDPATVPAAEPLDFPVEPELGYPPDPDGTPPGNN